MYMYMHVYFSRPVDVSLYRFDSNCITPGTDFMVRLHEQLKYFVNQKVATDHSWQNVEVVLSGQEVGSLCVYVCVCKRWGVCSYSVCIVIHVYMYRYSRWGKEKNMVVLLVCVCVRVQEEGRLCVCVCVCVLNRFIYDLILYNLQLVPHISTLSVLTH